MNTKELLQTRMAELRAEVEEIKARVAPERARLDALCAQQNALDAEIAAVSAAWHRFDGELIAKKEEIAAAAHGLGAKRMSGQ